MDHVDLPLLSGDSTPDVAITRMNQAGRRFVIVNLVSRGFHSFANKEILGAWAVGVETLHDVSGGQPVLQVAVHGSPEFLALLPWGHPDRESARIQMERANLLFGVSEDSVPIDGMIQVLTIHEGVRGDALSTTTDCICRNCGLSDQCPPANSSGQCPMCGQSTWRCA